MKLKVKRELFDLLVTATCRLAFPSSMISITSSGLDTNLSLAPCRNHINLFKILLLENLQCTSCCYPEPYMTSASLLLVNFAVQLVECLLHCTCKLYKCSFLGIFCFKLQKYCKRGNFVGLAEWPPCQLHQMVTPCLEWDFIKDANFLKKFFLFHFLHVAL